MLIIFLKVLNLGTLTPPPKDAIILTILYIPGPPEDDLDTHQRGHVLKKTIILTKSSQGSEDYNPLYTTASKDDPEEEYNPAPGRLYSTLGRLLVPRKKMIMILIHNHKNPKNTIFLT